MPGMGEVAAARALSDEEVVTRVREGETGLFEILMRRYNQRLFRVTRSILSDDSEAEDVIQDAYVRAYIHLDQFEGRARFSTWLTRIAVHEAIARSQKRQRFVAINEFPLNEDRINLKSDTPSPEEEVHTRTIRMVLETALDNLPANYRLVLVMRDVEGMSTAETADLLEVSEESVRVRLHRARSMMRRQIYEQTGASTSAAFHFAGARCDQLVSAVLEKIRALERGFQ